MAFSLGELFVDLGFDVDDEKLKSFTAGVKESTEWMQKQAIAATGAVTAINLFVQKQADHTLKLRELNSELNVNTREMQEWALVAHQMNPTTSVDTYIDNIARLQKAIGDVSQGGGPSGALARLAGGNVVGKSATEVLEMIAANRPNFLRDNGPQAQTIWTGLSNNVASLAPFVRAMQLSHEERAARAAPYIVGEDQQEPLNRFGDATAKLSEGMGKLESTIAAHLAPALTQLIQALNDTVDAWGRNEDSVGDALLNEKEKEKKSGFFKWLLIDPFIELAGGTPNGESKSAAHTLPAITVRGNEGAAPGNTRGMRNNNPGNIEYGAFAKAHGATSSDGRFAIFPDQKTGIAAIAALLKIYAKENRDTIASIVDHYTKGDSPTTQKSYKSTLSRFTGAGVNQHLNLSDPAVLESLIRGIMYQENAGGRGGIGNVTMNIHSNATDNKQVADEAVNALKRTYSNAYSEFNLGPQF